MLFDAFEAESGIKVQWVPVGRRGGGPQPQASIRRLRAPSTSRRSCGPTVPLPLSRGGQHPGGTTATRRRTIDGLSAGPTSA